MRGGWKLKTKRLKDRSRGVMHYMQKSAVHTFNSRVYSDLHLEIFEYSAVDLSVLYVCIDNAIYHMKKYPTLKLKVSFELKAEYFELYYDMTARLVKSLLEHTRNRYLFAPQLDYSIIDKSFSLKLKIYEQLAPVDRYPNACKYFKYPFNRFTDMLHHAFNDESIFDFDEIKSSIAEPSSTNASLEPLTLAYSYMRTFDEPNVIREAFANLSDDEYDSIAYSMNSKLLLDAIIDGSVPQLLDNLKSIAERFNIEVKTYDVKPLNLIESALLALRAYLCENITMSNQRYDYLLKAYNQAYDNWMRILSEK